MILVGELFSLLAYVDAGVGCFTSKKGLPGAGGGCCFAAGCFQVLDGYEPRAEDPLSPGEGMREWGESDITMYLYQGIKAKQTNLQR